MNGADISLGSAQTIDIELKQTTQGVGVGIGTTSQDIGVEVDSEGLAKVAHDETLVGDGTESEPLGVNTDMFISDVSGEGNIVVERDGGTISISQKTFIFTQGQAASVWLINHNLNKRPDAVVVDSAGSTIRGAITYIDDNTIEITFTAPVAGDAYLN